MASFEEIHKVHLERDVEIRGCEVKVELEREKEFNNRNLVSVTDLGARGNDSDDDTTAVQAAVDRVLDQGGGIVIFPPGGYVIDSVKVGPGVTLWGYGSKIVKPGIAHYAAKHLRARGLDPQEAAVARRVEELRKLAFEVEQSDLARSIVTLTSAPEELTEENRDTYLSPEELEVLRRQVGETLAREPPGDLELRELMEQLQGTRGQAKWSRTFHTGASRFLVDRYHYSGDEDPEPVVLKGFHFFGNRREMGKYDRYELEQQHMIFLSANLSASATS